MQHGYSAFVTQQHSSSTPQTPKTNEEIQNSQLFLDLQKTHRGGQVSAGPFVLDRDARTTDTTSPTNQPREPATHDGIVQ